MYAMEMCFGPDGSEVLVLTSEVRGRDPAEKILRAFKSLTVTHSVTVLSVCMRNPKK